MNASKVSRRDFFRAFSKGIFGEFQRGANPPSPQVAFLDTNRCLAWGNMTCQACYLACHLREKAITIQDQKPVISADHCDGCTKCVDACRTVNDPPSILMKKK